MSVFWAQPAMRKMVVLGFWILCGGISPLLAWGEEGHRIVAEIARRHMDPEVLKEVELGLDGMSLEEASTWMDDVRREKRYYHMVTWHYVNLEKGEKYHKNNKEENAINSMRDVVKKLNNREKYTKGEIAVFIRVLFHLVGDLHQPMHTGYGSDRGGNNIHVTFDGKATNLHGVWDYNIIKSAGITAGDCMALKESLSSADLKSMKKLNVFEWFKESRKHLDFAYSFKDGVIDQKYTEQAAGVIKLQLLRAGVRLAAILTRLYKKAEPAIEKDEQEGRLPSFNWPDTRPRYALGANQFFIVSSALPAKNRRIAVISALEKLRFNASFARYSRSWNVVHALSAVS